jgi:hypothetical protein
MQYCHLFLLMLYRRLPTQYSCFDSFDRFLQQFDRLRLTTIYRDRIRLNETFIYTIQVSPAIHGGYIPDEFQTVNTKTGCLGLN